VKKSEPEPGYKIEYTSPPARQARGLAKAERAKLIEEWGRGLIEPACRPLGLCFLFGEGAHFILFEGEL
jgi:hypothetical protein